MRNMEAAQLESSLAVAGMPPDFATPELSIVPPRQGVIAVPYNIRLVSGAAEGPSITIGTADIRDGVLHPADEEIFHSEPEWPWANEGKLRLEYEHPPVGTDADLERFHQPLPRQGACLEGFISLAELPPDEFPEAVLRFAKKWGVLGICRHGKPSNHCQAPHNVAPPCRIAYQSRIGLVYVFSEPIEAWERYSSQLRAILCVAANLRTGKAGSPQNWHKIEQGEPPELPPFEREDWGLPDYVNLPPIGRRISPGKRRLLIEKSTLASNVGKWLTYGGVGVFPWWNDLENRLKTYLTYDSLDTSLPGRLAVELCAMLSFAVYRCKGCAEPFGAGEEEKKRPSNKDAWCGRKECKQIQAREASQRHYLKNRQAR